MRVFYILRLFAHTNFVFFTFVTGTDPQCVVDTVRMKRRKPDYWIAFVTAVHLPGGAELRSFGSNAEPFPRARVLLHRLPLNHQPHERALASLPKLSASDAWMLGVLSKSQYFCAYTVLGVVVANYLLHVETRVDAALKDARIKKARRSGRRSAI